MLAISKSQSAEGGIWMASGKTAQTIVLAALLLSGVAGIINQVVNRCARPGVPSLADAME